MKCKTHIVASNAINLLILHPTTIPLLLTTVCAGTIGGAISDIDTRKAESTQILSKINIITTSIAFILFSIIQFHIFNIQKFRNDIILHHVITFLLTLLICNYGSKTPHRSFTHSFLFPILLYIILSYSLNDHFTIPFTIGILSHVFLDIWNHIGITLFYPIKERFCFDLVDSDGLINKLIFYGSLFLINAYLVIYFII